MSRTWAEFTAELIDKGHIIPTGARGIVGRGRAFEEVVAGLSRAMRRRIEADVPVEFVNFPPVSPQAVFELTDYVSSFPQLIGSVRVFTGGQPEHKQLLTRRAENADWTELLVGSELMLTAAGCHPLYGVMSSSTLRQPRRFDLVGHCFRHEPSEDPSRMVTFRMHEQVYAGSAQGALEHRDLWLEKFRDLVTELELEFAVDIANDPFFGRAGKMLAVGQREEALKFEVLAPISGDGPTAIASANAHQDHFGVNFEITLPDGGPAHTSCAGLGMERTTLALLSQHGTDVEAWPATVRAALEL